MILLRAGGSEAAQHHIKNTGGIGRKQMGKSSLAGSGREPHAYRRVAVLPVLHSIILCMAI
jgi:hypothetical protein